MSTYTAEELAGNGIVFPKDDDWNDFVKYAQYYGREAKWGLWTKGGLEYTSADIREFEVSLNALQRSGTRLSGEDKSYCLHELAKKFREGYRVSVHQSRHYLASPRSWYYDEECGWYTVRDITTTIRRKNGGWKTVGTYGIKHQKFPLGVNPNTH